MTTAMYDAHADWYEGYVSGTEYSDRVAGTLRALLGDGHGRRCLDVCCGTGARAQTLVRAGWRPVGVDISTGQLRHAVPRMPVAVGDATALPVAGGSLDAAVCVLAHTDVPDYAAVVREIARTLKPGAPFVHIGIHPCFCGYFADWSDRSRVVLTPGYSTPKHSFDAWSPDGVRARVGAWHLTLAGLVDAILQAGLRITGIVESGLSDLPDFLGIAAVRQG